MQVTRMQKHSNQGRHKPGPSTTPAGPTRRHLYLVLDDWSLGYSFRKIDLKAYQPRAGLKPLPTPIFLLEAPCELPMYFAAAFGSKIIAMQPTIQFMDDHGLAEPLIAPFFDVHMQALTYGPKPIEVLSCPVFIPIAAKLLALCGESLLLLDLQEKPIDLWSWCKLLHLPFDSRNVTSYAVHPDGQSIFVSVGGFTPGATFSFSVDGEFNRYALSGQCSWVLPFTGSSYFVSELNAWIGLSNSERIGYLCACTVVAADSISSHRPSWKLSKEKVFTNNPAETHIGATLVYMGSKNKFCLVECICVDENYVCKVLDNKEGEDVKSYRYLFRLMTFSLMYDEDGDLTTGNTCRVQYYSAPEAVTRSAVEYPMAFYL